MFEIIRVYAFVFQTCSLWPVRLSVCCFIPRPDY